MPRMTLAQSEIVKRRLVRTREHIARLDSSTFAAIGCFSFVTYEIASGLGLPAVRHLESATAGQHQEDALTNLSTIIEFDLTLLDLSRDPEECVLAAQELMTAVQQVSIARDSQLGAG
jgi:hypothetical protein